MSKEIGDAVSEQDHSNGDVSLRTLYGPKHVLAHINDLGTPCPIKKYVDDSIMLEICNQIRVSVIHDSANINTLWSNNHIRVRHDYMFNL